MHDGAQQLPPPMGRRRCWLLTPGLQLSRVQTLYQGPRKKKREEGSRKKKSCSFFPLVFVSRSFYAVSEDVFVLVSNALPADLRRLLGKWMAEHAYETDPVIGTGRRAETEEWVRFLARSFRSSFFSDLAPTLVEFLDLKCSEV